MYALEPGVKYLARALKSVHRLRERYERQHASGSQFAIELEASSGRRHQHLLEANALAWARMFAAEEHLGAMTTLIPDEATLYSTYTLARTTAELSARAWWLLDPDLDGDDRAQRGLAERRYSLQQIRSLGVEGGSENASERLRELMRAADAEGLTVRKSNKRPDGTALMGELLHGDDLGPVIYRLLSAFTHGTAYALHHLARRDTVRDGATEGMVEVQLGTGAGTEAQVLLMAVLPWKAALAYQCRLNGWDASHVMAELVYASADIRRVMETYPRDA